MERVAFNSEYPTILGKHIWCASVESGIEADERKLCQRFGGAAPQLLQFLEQRGDVARRDSDTRRGAVWVGRGYPHRDVSLRGGESFADVRAVWSKNNAIIETLGQKQAIMRLFPGAIFMSADDQTGTVMRFDVLSLDLSPDKRLAVLAASKYPPGTTVSPLRDNSVTMTKKWGHKRFNLPGGTGSLTVTYGWCTLTSRVYGCEVKSRARSSKGDDTSGLPAFGRTLYDQGQRFEWSHEAPCLRFRLDEPAKAVLRIRLRADVMPTLQETFTASPDLAERFNRLRNLDAAYIAIHTFLHQLMSVVPLLLLSSQDVEEGTLNALDCEGYLVDSCDGGTGVCEELFENFLSFVAKAKEYMGSCLSCQKAGVWGCATCLYQNHCPTYNDALVAALGAELFGIREAAEEPTTKHADRPAPQEKEADGAQDDQEALLDQFVVPATKRPAEEEEEELEVADDWEGETTAGDEFNHL